MEPLPADKAAELNGTLEPVPPGASKAREDRETLVKKALFDQRPWSRTVSEGITEVLFLTGREPTQKTVEQASGQFSHHAASAKRTTYVSIRIKTLAGQALSVPTHLRRGVSWGNGKEWLFGPSEESHYIRAYLESRTILGSVEKLYSGKGIVSGSKTLQNMNAGTNRLGPHIEKWAGMPLEELLSRWEDWYQTFRKPPLRAFHTPLMLKGRLLNELRTRSWKPPWQTER